MGQGEDVPRGGDRPEVVGLLREHRCAAKPPEDTKESIAVSFMVVQKAVQEKYPSTKVEGKGIGGRTGCFEVTVMKSNGKSKKIHSKLAGEGFVTSENVEGMLKKLAECLAEK